MQTEDDARLSVGSLFTGIGGIDIGFERAGFHIKFQVEINEYCRLLLRHHWPEVALYEDVCTLGTGGGIPGIGVLVGGYPCQGNSLAGKRAGHNDARSGLWREYARIIDATRPNWVVVENVTGLLSVNSGRDFGTVLGDLATLGYDAWWDCIPAAAVGAPQIRDRVWIVAHAQSDGEWTGLRPYTSSAERHGRSGYGSSAQFVTDTDRAGCPQQWWKLAVRKKLTITECIGGWPPESGICRVAYGVPNRVDRLTALGGAAVPQVAEWVARQIYALEMQRIAARGSSCQS